MSLEELGTRVYDHTASTGMYTPDLIDHMRDDGVYGNGATLKAAATFLNIQITLVTDGHPATEIINPLGGAAGSEITLAYYIERHYEATTALVE